MSKRQPIYEGKAKKLFEGPEPGTLIQHFKDDATAFNNEKKGSISGKGVINNRICEFIYTRLSEMGIPTHFIKGLNMREQLVYAVEIIPIEVIIRNYTAGSFVDRFKTETGEPLGGPLIEYCLKDDAMGDPFIAEEHIYAFDLCDPAELEEIRIHSIRINDYLCGLFRGAGIKLVDMKLEFGRVYTEDGFSQLVLADEISPDNCRLWDIETDEVMDKDRFRQDMGKVAHYYREVARRIGVLMADSNEDVVEQLPTAKVPAKGKAKKAPAKGRKPAAKKPTSPRKKT